MPILNGFKSFKYRPVASALSSLVAVLGVSTLSSAAATSWDGFNPLACGALDYQGMRLQKPAPTEDPCTGLGTRVLAVTSSHLLYLCQGDKTVASYDISIGANGVGKRADGDQKTPLGDYTLAAPRTSDTFGLFILVGYPTDEQVKQGYTGDSIGVHGPRRGNECKQLQNVSQDWTEGCMAVTNDVFIGEIADFVVKNTGVGITIR